MGPSTESLALADYLISKLGLQVDRISLAYAIMDHVEVEYADELAQPSPVDQDVRAQFEAWMATQHDQGSEHVMAMVGATDDRYQSPLTSSMWSAWQAASAAREGGRINGWRIVDGVLVFSASAHASIVDDQHYVRYDDYLSALAARQPEVK